MDVYAEDMGETMKNKDKKRFNLSLITVTILLICGIIYYTQHTPTNPTLNIVDAPDTINISESDFSNMDLFKLQLLAIAPEIQGQLAYVTGFSTYSSGRYMEVLGTQYSRPDTSQTYGCPADPYVQWHISCYYGCFGTTVNPGTRQGQVNIVLDWVSSHTIVVLGTNFYNGYKLEIEDWMLRHPNAKNIYIYASKSGGSGPDSHCYYIDANQLVLKCSDGTLYNSCSLTKPQCCINGQLINNASKCGCPHGYIPDGNNCLIITEPLILNPNLTTFFDAYPTFESDSVTTISVGKPYTTTLSLSFDIPIDNNYTAGIYEVKKAEWFIIDESNNILKESGWSNELSSSPFVYTATFTPTLDGKFYLIGLVIKQQYTYNTTGWSSIDSVENIEIHKIITYTPSIFERILDFLTSILSWFKGLL